LKATAYALILRKKLNTAYVETTDRLELTGRVREALSDLMEIDRYSWDERGTLTLRGRLSGPADALYRAIRTRMERLGFTPFLRHDAAGDELVAMPGVIERRAPRIWLPVGLFLATIVTVMMTGAINAGVDVFSDPRAIIAGLPFAITLLGILFTHEMGHYVVGRLRNAPVSLPYFIPVPPGISLIGTMGAVIVQREVQIPDGCDREELERSIHAVEHELYPEAIRMIARGTVRIDASDPRVVVTDE